MDFGEIFNNDGMYKADSFTEGFCLKIEDGYMYGLTYSSKDDLKPETTTFPMYKGLLTKKYTRVLTRQSLFKKLKKE